MTRALIIIPARMASTRLPDKPLADIEGEPMIVHVWRKAHDAAMGRVVVAADSDEIVNAVRSAGGEAMITRPDHVSGSDRIFEALSRIDPESEADIVVNLQGDLPTIDPALIRECASALDVKGPDIATLAAEITDPDERTNPNVVKIVGTPLPEKNRLRALYFTRATAPHGDGPLFHHIGLYAYRRTAIERFVSLPPSYLETREKLEQLRALEDGMRIDVAIVDTVPLGVDTPDDLERARKLVRKAKRA
ncbi:3-deoxy-manno-octulosonate cytidylyltransferase [Hyphomicrobium nitrativorans NL23]|uniref:3-deoxy-manno-octulosonate cytidylyltransferase n=1 Tax=Hyphomicrobium nitrativorans NL23 TaxID=1029756 RepID=V5SD99_9HYPH|nr:3-deoxy-manno-octulosonate cytidylyltransferase [Hyphomicrobium nitrativorans]AHB47929.1 3-deoxy-manno-octulosonate cytidylyltransferase [Hyphomicrobium nitrativorans NL23]